MRIYRGLDLIVCGFKWIFHWFTKYMQINKLHRKLPKYFAPTFSCPLWKFFQTFFATPIVKQKYQTNKTKKRLKIFATNKISAHAHSDTAMAVLQLNTWICNVADLIWNERAKKKKKLFKTLLGRSRETEKLCAFFLREPKPRCESEKRASVAYAVDDVVLRLSWELMTSRPNGKCFDASLLSIFKIPHLHTRR